MKIKFRKTNLIYLCFEYDIFIVKKIKAIYKQILFLMK